MIMVLASEDPIVLGVRRDAAEAAGGLIAHCKAKVNLACGGEDLGLHSDSFCTCCRQQCQPRAYAYAITSVIFIRAASRSSLASFDHVRWGRGTGKRASVAERIAARAVEEGARFSLSAATDAQAIWISVGNSVRLVTTAARWAMGATTSTSEIPNPPFERVTLLGCVPRWPINEPACWMNAYSPLPHDL